MDQLQESMQQLSTQQHQLAAQVAETKSTQAVAAAHTSWMKDALNRIEISIKPLESMERRVALLEKAVFGLIIIVLGTVIGALVKLVVNPLGGPTP